MLVLTPWACCEDPMNVWDTLGTFGLEPPSRLYLSNCLVNSYSSFKTWMKAGQQQVRVKGRTCS